MPAPPSRWQAPGQRDNLAGPNGGRCYLFPGNRAQALLARPWATQTVRSGRRVPGSCSLLGRAEGAGPQRGEVSPRRARWQQQGQGRPVSPGSCRWVLAARLTSGPRAPGAAPGLTCTARVKKMPASDASFFMLKSMARPHARPPRGPQRCGQPPARPRRRRRPHPAHLLPAPALRRPVRRRAAAEPPESRAGRRGRGGAWRAAAGLAAAPAGRSRPRLSGRSPWDYYAWKHTCG